MYYDVLRLWQVQQVARDSTAAGSLAQRVGR